MSLTASDDALKRSFARDGFALLPDLLPAADCAAITPALQPQGLSGGTRSLLAQPWCAALAQRLRRHPLLQRLLPPGHKAVQCSYFEKSAASNWLVPMHQDLSIPVARRVDGTPLGGWSEKEGTLYVQAPAELLVQMLALRLHLDPCAAHDGPLRVVPGSHALGLLDAQQEAKARARGGEHLCLARAGSAWVMRPLLLHASAKSQGTSRRRVLHFLFGPNALPHGLQWAAQA